MFRRNVITGLKRAGIEIGSGGRQSFTRLVVDNNWFDEFDFNPGDDGSFLPLPLVGQASQNPAVTKKLSEIGPTTPR